MILDPHVLEKIVIDNVLEFGEGTFELETPFQVPSTMFLKGSNSANPITFYIGVDPGISGAIAIYDGKEFYAVSTMGLAGKELDLTGISKWILDYVRSDHCIAGIEKVSAMPKQGVTSMFNFGFNTGAIHGILASLGIPRYLITPQAWKKEILAGTSKDKDAAIAYCRRVYPDISLLATPKSRTPHSGMADAMCIALYTKIKHGG